MQIKPASLAHRGWQIFLCDTSNVEIELNFETQDEVAA
jgi:hypothetical protein